MSESFLSHFLHVQQDLRAFIGAMVRDPAAREDVFQEVSMTLWKSYPKFDASRSFGAWARGVAARKILENHRYRSRLPESVTPEVLDSVAAAFTPEDELWQQRERALKECIGQLPKQSGLLVSERYSEGLSMEEMKRQARELNLDRDALFDRLSISLPAEAAQRRVSLRSGAISFLKAMRTVADLAHCDVSIEAEQIAISARAIPSKSDEQSLTPDRLLADARGVPQPLAGERLAEMLVDAAGLGMRQKVNPQGQTELIGTAAQFAALDQLTQARDQIRVMPPLPLRVYVRQNHSLEEDRVLDRPEADRVRLELSAQQSPAVLLRLSSNDAALQEVVEQQAASEQAAPSMVVSSRPAGDGYVALTFTGRQPESLPSSDGTVPPVLTDAVLSPGQALVTNLQPALAQSQASPFTQGDSSLRNPANQYRGIDGPSATFQVISDGGGGLTLAAMSSPSEQESKILTFNGVRGQATASVVIFQE